MHPLDAAILITLAILAITGLVYGLIRLAIPIVGLVFGVIMAGRFSSPLSSLLFPDKFWGEAASFAIIIVAFLIAAGIVASILRRVLKAVSLSWLDRLGGFLLLTALGIFLWTFLLHYGTALPYAREIIEKAPLASLLASISLF